MRCVLGFHSGDSDQALQLLIWMEELGGCPNDELLLVADSGMNWAACVDIMRQGNKVFRLCNIISTDQPYKGWPKACNQMFRTAAQWCEENRKGPWLWLEPDAIPLHRHWLDDIQTAYVKSGSAFLGAVITGQMFGQPKTYLNGVAVYPEDAASRMGSFFDSELAFDVAASETVLPAAANSDLFHCHWGFKDHAPVFVGHRHIEDPDNFVTLDFIRPGAAIFHRSKDGSLIRLMRAQIQPPINLVIVLPFCQKDAALMVRHLEWMALLHGKKKAQAVVHFDKNISTLQALPVIRAAQKVFESILVSNYPATAVGWPAGPNSAWQAAARFMAHSVNRPWLWYEADAVPVRADWMEQLDREYARAGKPFMGCHIDGIVPISGHYNGVACYPANTAQICQHAMRATGLAFDTEMARDMTHLAHNASHLIQHCRDQPTFHNKEDVARFVGGQTVLYHPDKNGSLVSQL